MLKNYNKINIIILTLLILIIIRPGTKCLAANRIYHTKYTVIYYSQKTQLKNLLKAATPRKSNFIISNILSGSSSKVNSSLNLRDHIDSLFRRVQLILDMPAPKFKIKIRLYDTQKQISKAYFDLTALNDKIVAFYWHDTKTIYLQKKNLTVGILAHEIGHSIIDHYFIIKPPVKVSELLTQYVDKVVTRDFK